MNTARFPSCFGGIGHALSARDYRIYWYGHVFSAHGVWMHRIAVGVLIFQLTGSPAWLGFIGFVYSLPLMLLGPIAGAIGDRIGIRRTAIIAIVITIGLTCCKGALTLTGDMTPELLAVLVLILGAVHAFDFPVRQVLIQLLVGRERMSAAIALNTTTFYTASFTGPMLCAGFLNLGARSVGDTAPGLIFILYGLTMVALLVGIVRTRMRDQPLEQTHSDRFLGDVFGGLRYTLAHPSLRLILIMWSCVALLGRPYVDLMPGYALAVFDHGTDGLGTMMAASGIGALSLSAFMAVRGRIAGLTLILIVAAAAASAALIVFAITDRFWLAAVLMAPVGGGMVVGSIAAQSLIQNATRTEFRARVISVYFALVIGAQSIGVLLIGWVAEYTGFRLAVAGAGTLSLLAVACLGRGLWRRAAVLEAPGT